MCCCHGSEEHARLPQTDNSGGGTEECGKQVCGEVPAPLGPLKSIDIEVQYAYTRGGGGGGRWRCCI